MPKAMPPLGEVTQHVVHQEYFDVELRGDGVVWLQRNDVPYPEVRAVHQAYDAFLRLVDDWLLDRRIKGGLIGTKQKAPIAWLYDVRGAPTRRNDPEFEAVVQERRPDLLKRSPHLAVLVKTASGKMQVTRLARMGRADLLIFDNFDEALDTLRERIRGEL